jgi:hypothetical protein
VLSRFFYPLFKLNKLENKVVFISAKLTELTELVEKQLTDQFRKEWPEYKIRVYLQKKKSFKGFVGYLRDLATSKVIVTDDYTNPFNVYKRRPGIKVIERHNLNRVEQRHASGYKEL